MSQRVSALVHTQEPQTILVDQDFTLQTYDETVIVVATGLTITLPQNPFFGEKHTLYANGAFSFNVTGAPTDPLPIDPVTINSGGVVTFLFSGSGWQSTLANGSNGVPPGFCTLEQFGGKGLGFVSEAADSAAWIAAIAAIGAAAFEGVYITPRPESLGQGFAVTGALLTGAGAKNAVVCGAGDCSILLTHNVPGAVEAVLQVAGASPNAPENVTVRDFKIKGVNATANKWGVQSGGLGAHSGPSNLRIMNITIDAVGGLGITWGDTNIPDETGPMISNCRSMNNTIPGGNGFWAADQFTGNNNEAISNTTGVTNATGNMDWEGDIILNTTGMTVIAGGNDGHGIVHDSNINHNTTALNVGDIHFGMSWVDNHFFQGDILLNGAPGSVSVNDFDDCEIDLHVYLNTGGLARFNTPLVSTTSFFSYANAAGGVTVWNQPILLDGTIPAYTLPDTAFSVAMAALGDIALGDQVGSSAGTRWGNLRLSANNLIHRFLTNFFVTNAGGGTSLMQIDATAIHGPIPFAGSQFESKPFQILEVDPVFAADANIVLTPAQFQAGILEFTSTVPGGLTATRNVQPPVVKGAIMIVANLTAGAQSLTFIGATGAGPTVTTGKRAILYCNGTNWEEATSLF